MIFNGGLDLGKYETLVFDCDGVILNSNKVKTQAFYNAALPYGERAAQMLVNYHVENGGVSRYKKFEFFYKSIIPFGTKGPSIQELICTYACNVREGLLACDVVKGLKVLREKTLHANWVVVSGGDQVELREIFYERDLIDLFDGGIFGSPSTKDEIFTREMIMGKIKSPAIYFGDSKYDLESSRRAGLDFVFVSAWSEIHESIILAENRAINVITDFSCLID